MTLPEQPAERHRRIGAGFTEKVEGTAPDRWDAATPVPDWTARDVVRHLTQWLASFLAAGSAARLPSGPPVDDDPVAAWRTHAAAVQALLEDPATAELTLTNAHIGELPLDRAIDQFYTTDVFLHTWDLARATGQDDRLDPDFCRDLLAGMEPLDEVLRLSGQYGPKVEVPAGADAQTKLIGFIGRDPFWEPLP